MSDPASAFSVQEAGGVLAGPVRSPRNSARHLGAGSIHDDATAQKLGFRGGTVAGSLHMEQLPPLLIAVFGREWLATGGMSLYFRHATTDGEPVRASVRRPQPGDARAELWMDDTHGNRVCDGTASVGDPDMGSLLRQRIAATPAPGELRILAGVEVGVPGAAGVVRLTEEQQQKRLDVITERLPEYEDGTHFGRRVATPALQVTAHRAAEAGILRRGADFGVGLFGAIELQALGSPVLIDVDYEARARVLALGDTPKTEYLWYESTLRDMRTNRVVSRMLMMLRTMKASSALWQS